MYKLRKELGVEDFNKIFQVWLQGCALSLSATHAHANLACPPGLCSLPFRHTPTSHALPRRHCRTRGFMVLRLTELDRELSLEGGSDATHGGSTSHGRCTSLHVDALRAMREMRETRVHATRTV